jgi:methyl-accepting chemotaxis protein
MISQIIQELQVRTNEILTKTQIGKENSQKLKESNVNRISNIEEINISMSEVVTGIEQMSSAMQEQSANIVEIANKTEEVTKMINV